MGNMWEVCSQKYSRRLHREPKKFFFSYKQVSGRNSDHEWCRITNAFILCDLLWKVKKSHAANREGSFKNVSKQLGTARLHGGEALSLDHKL